MLHKWINIPNVITLALTLHTCTHTPPSHSTLHTTVNDLADDHTFAVDDLDDRVPASVLIPSLLVHARHGMAKKLSQTKVVIPRPAMAWENIDLDGT